ncbi:MAG: nicotinate-nucleotide--dimethylbenzimidazole phosphoribosyltransferase [Cocleimonas sp.]
MNWIKNPCPQRKPSFKDKALARQTQLTKPLGSLGVLEELAVRLADCQQHEKPSANNVAISVFAGDHGIAEEGVSAFPQEVTLQMVMNFLQGGAAISVLSQQLNAKMEVVDTGILHELPEQAGLIIQRAGNGTANSANQPAMTQEQLNVAIEAGYDSIKRAIKNKADIFIGGEMGIANSTSATVIYCALLGLTPEQTTGAGTGLDDAGVAHKTSVVQRILDKHKSECADDALAWLRCVGGFEIVALTGAYIRAAQSGLPVLVDGFISSVAALCAVKINPEVNDYLFFSHVSAEQGHRKVLVALEQTPLLDLGMRLGEGSGAAVAVTLLQSACLTHNNMATFEEAMVATKS